MTGTILMEIDEAKTKVRLDVRDVDLADKCALVDNLLDALEVKGLERVLVLSLVMKLSSEEENRDESGCFRNQNV